MFLGLFKKHVPREDIFEQENNPVVDPVVEQRRKEKFSTPLIYDEEFKNDDESQENHPREEKRSVKTVEKKVQNEPKQIIDEEPIEVYHMSEIISPMRGVTKSKEPEKKVSKKSSVRPKRILSDDQLVPVLSPYFGNFEKKIEVETESKLTDITEPKVEESIKEVEEKIEPVIITESETSLNEKDKLPTVEDNLRNIAKIVEEEKDRLKIIEKSTGEFKLDFAGDEKNDNTLIDEIDDDMSLDELMSLYEKKFKD